MLILIYRFLYAITKQVAFVPIVKSQVSCECVELTLRYNQMKKRKQQHHMYLLDQREPA